MPLFDYKCRACGKPFEVLVRTRNTDAVECPLCASSEVERLIALPAPGRVVEGQPATNCRSAAPPCGAPWCGRKG